MSTLNVLRLDDYRERRRQRVRLARALHGFDPRRLALIKRLIAVVDTVGADRAAVVWVDEYGPGKVHAHVVLDLVSDVPRRAFSGDILRRAWDLGVPGQHEVPSSPSRPGEVSSPWTVAVAMGSDGSRSWFVVADSLSPRPALSAGAREKVMFQVGECASVVLHRDMDPLVAIQAELDQDRAAHFAGWAILQDLDSCGDDDAGSRRTSLRFIVGRLARLLLDEDLTVPTDRREDQVRRAREEIESQRGDLDLGDEKRIWDDLLRAYEEGDFGGLTIALREAAGAAEADDFHRGASELYELSYEVAVAAGAVDDAIEAARSLGRVHRRRSQWTESQTWYELAKSVGLTAGLGGRAALAVAGLATLQRERGNYPAARETLAEGLRLAETAKDPQAIGQVHLDTMSLEHVAGALDAAVREGWKAFWAYDDRTHRTRGLAGLSAVLQEAGCLDAAEDGWTLVAHLAEDKYYRLFAADALSHLAALRGDVATFHRRAAESDALGWESGPAAAKADILLYRGRSYEVLGRIDEARAWFERAVAFSATNKLGDRLFDAEAALQGLESGGADPGVTKEPPTPEASTARIGEELSVLRAELTAVPV